MEEKDPIFQETKADDGSFKEPEKDITSSISERLSEETVQEKETDSFQSENPTPIDISKLTKEQIQTLKAMLNATPDGQVTRKKSNPKVFIREIDGRLISDFKRAYLGLVEDPENHRRVERHIIPVKFMGDDNYVDVLYSKFINSNRVACEVVSQRNKVEEYIEGETVSRETGQLVEMIRKEVKYWFTIKLPSGETTEIEARLANA